MSSIAHLEGGAASSRGDAYLPAWSRDTAGVATDSAAFAARVGVDAGQRRHGAATNALGLLRTTEKDGFGGRRRLVRGAAGFGFRKHGEKEAKPGAAGFRKLGEKEIKPGVVFVTSVHAQSRARQFELDNAGEGDVELTLSFRGSVGVTLDGEAGLARTTLVEAGHRAVVGSISIAPGNASVRMGLSCKTFPKKRKDQTKKKKKKKKNVASTSAAQSTPTPANSTTSASPPSGASSTAVAAHAFAAAEDDECTLTQDDEVLVKSEDHQGWILVLNLTSGKEGLVPTNHLDFMPAARSRPRRGSVNHIYSKAGVGSWKSGSQLTRRQPTKRPPKNDPNDWKDRATSSEIRHNGKTGLILGETDGVAIVQFNDGSIGEVPSGELVRAGGAPATTASTTIGKKKTGRGVIQRNDASTIAVVEKRYLTERAIDGIRIDQRSGKVRKAKAAVPGQAQLNAFRGKGSSSSSSSSCSSKKGPPPPRPARKKWPTVRT
jgi:hypothetical protein